MTVPCYDIVIKILKIHVLTHVVPVVTQSQIFNKIGLLQNPVNVWTNWLAVISMTGQQRQAAMSYVIKQPGNPQGVKTKNLYLPLYTCHSRSFSEGT